MRVIPYLVLVAISFGAGAAVAQLVSRHHPAGAPSPQAATAPADAEASRDPKADLQGQMMWDPNTRTYQGG